MPGFLATLAIAVVVGWAGDAVIRGNMPGGFWGSILAGLLGSWIGAYTPMLNTLGPRVFDISIIPALIGAVVSVTILGFFKTTASEVR